MNTRFNRRPIPSESRPTLNPQRRTTDIESSTRDYATRFNGKVGAWFLQQQKDASQKIIHGSDLKVLDVGGGHGQNIETISELGHALTIYGSTDSSTEMIQSAINSKVITFETGSLLELPYEDNSFDIVISYRTVSHMDQLEAFIAELSRVAKSLVIVDYPSIRSFNIFYNILFFLKKLIETNTREFNYYTAKTMARYFGKHHFKLASRHKQFFLPMALHRIIGKLGLTTVSEKIFRSLGLTEIFGSPVIASFENQSWYKVPNRVRDTMDSLNDDKLKYKIIYLAFKSSHERQPWS